MGKLGDPLASTGIPGFCRASDSIGAVSDFGLDRYALDGADTAGHLHPLEIARDLIAGGKPRSALEVLSLHFDTHADDPEYLLLCAEAWRATGDTLRAQQALLGAIRVVPNDPRPLRSLSELLEERGERERAERVLAKVRALELSAGDATDLPEEVDLDGDEDLIAAAERRERGSGLGRPVGMVRYVSLVLAGLGTFALLIAGISLLTEARAVQDSGEPKPAGDREASAPLAVEPVQETDPVVSPPMPEVPNAVPDTIALEETVALPPAPIEPLAALVPAAAEREVAANALPSTAPRTPKPATPRASQTTAKQGRAAPPPKKVPEPQSEAAAPDVSLDSSDTARLTEHADVLYEQGQTALAASYYRRALDIDPDYAPALVGIGRGILRAEKYDEAMSNATRALQLARGVDARPGLEAEAIYQMGRVHLERGDRDAARQLLRQSVSLKEAPAEAWFYLGEALASDNSPAARRAYEKYLELVTSGHLADRARRAIQ